MAAPTVRGRTAPVSGLSTTSPAGTQIGDIVVCVMWNRHSGDGTIPTHTLQSGFTEIHTQTYTESSVNAGRLSTAYAVATVAGAQSYQPYTQSGGENQATLCVVIQGDTVDTGSIPAAGATTTNTSPPDPPSVTLDAARDWLVLAIGAWWNSAAQTVTVTAPTNYSNLQDIAGSNVVELASSERALTAAASENPAAYADTNSPSGTCSQSIGFRNSLPVRGPAPCVVQFTSVHFPNRW